MQSVDGELIIFLTYWLSWCRGWEVHNLIKQWAMVSCRDRTVGRLIDFASHYPQHRCAVFVKFPPTGLTFWVAGLFHLGFSPVPLYLFFLFFHSFLLVKIEKKSFNDGNKFILIPSRCYVRENPLRPTLPLNNFASMVNIYAQTASMKNAREKRKKNLLKL